MQVTVKCFFGICRWQIFSPSLGVTYTHHHDETVVVVALLSRAQLFVTPWTTAHQASCPSLSPRICSNSRPWRQWCHPNIYSLLPPSCFAFNLSQQQGLFQWVSSSYQVVKVIKFQHSVQFSRSVVSNSLRPHESQHARPLLSIINSWNPPKPMSIESVIPSNHLIPCRPLLLLPSIFPSIRVFSNESALSMRWPKYWSFRLNISPTNEHPGLISFRMDWLDLLAVQGTLKSLLQHHRSTASILQHSAVFIIQLSHPYMTTGKTIALTRWTFAGKIMSLLFNMLSRLVTIFLPRSKSLLISWLQSPSTVILESPKIVWHCFHCFPIYFPWSDGTRCHDLSILNVKL